LTLGAGIGQTPPPMSEVDAGARPGGAGADIPRREKTGQIERDPKGAGSLARVEAGPGHAD